MIERTLVPLETLLFFAGQSLVNEGMKLLLFPPMAERALLKPLAAFFIASYECTALPVLAKLSLVSKEVRFSAKVLEIMRVDTLRLVMLVVVRAPFGFEVEHVKVKVGMLWQQMMHQTHLDVVDTVRERAVLSVLALLHFPRKAMTELCLVLVFMIESFHSVVGSSASVPLRALLSVRELA